jgi:hypothetical protein
MGFVLHCCYVTRIYRQRADALAGKAAEKASWSPDFGEIPKVQRRMARQTPAPHGVVEETSLPPPPKKSCMDGARNSIAQTALALGNLLEQDQKENGRRVLVLRRTKEDDPLPCIAALSESQREDRDPAGVRVLLLANPRWEKRLLRFLELSGGWGEPSPTGLI